MKRTGALACCFGASIVLAGCGDGDPAAPPGGAAAGSGAASTSAGAGGGTTSGGGGSGVGGDAGQWTPIITADWELLPGSEKTSDVHTVTLDHDIYVGAIRPIAPVGTHHTVLAIGDLGAGNVIYASGVGTNPLVFPDGIGLKLPAGQSLILQLHLFNTSADTLTGTSGIEVVEIDPSALQSEADLFLPGPLDFSIPPNQTYTHTGTCTVGSTQNVFAIFPHMHQLGSHFKSTLTVGGQEKVIHDDDYAFVHQAFIPIEQVTLNAGDTVTTACTWTNTTTKTITWGESSTTEMCFSILYRYPAQNDGGFGFCTQ